MPSVLVDLSFLLKTFNLRLRSVLRVFCNDSQRALSTKHVNFVSKTNAVVLLPDEYFQNTPILPIGESMQSRVMLT